MTMHTTTASASDHKIASTRWRIDPAQSHIAFHTKTLMGLSTVKGHFCCYGGTLDLTHQPAIELTIESSSVDTRNTRRDAHLRSSDFLDAETHPVIRFVSSSAALDSDQLTVAGHLHARGHTLPLELEATVSHTYDELDLTATTYIDHQLLGMTWGKRILQTPSRLIVHARLFRDRA